MKRGKPERAQRLPDCRHDDLRFGIPGFADDVIGCHDCSKVWLSLRLLVLDEAIKNHFASNRGGFGVGRSRAAHVADCELCHEQIRAEFQRLWRDLTRLANHLT